MKGFCCTVLAVRFWSSFFKSLWHARVGGWSMPRPEDAWLQRSGSQAPQGLLSVIISDVARFKSDVVDVWIIRIRLCIEMNRSPSGEYIVCTLKQKQKIFRHIKFSSSHAATEGSREIFLVVIKKRAAETALVLEVLEVLLAVFLYGCVDFFLLGLCICESLRC